MRSVFVGEAMLELTSAGPDWRIGYGGDTLNTAIHLARVGHDTAYLTALGTDPFSQKIVEAWKSEGLDTSLVLTHPERLPGIYAIDVDPFGERSFLYWRENAAARAMFDLPGMPQALADAERADLLGLSLITFAILPEDARVRLRMLAADVRKRGGRIALDGNFRPRLWRSTEEARRTLDLAISQADFGFPTLSDEVDLRGASSARDVQRHWQGLGCREVVVKLGVDGCLLPDDTVVAPDHRLSPVDTSGAGDAFNAGYLAARCNGASMAEAARAGHELAGWTIMRVGAVPPLGS